MGKNTRDHTKRIQKRKKVDNSLTIVGDSHRRSLVDLVKRIVLFVDRPTQTMDLHFDADRYGVDSPDQTIVSNHQIDSIVAVLGSDEQRIQLQIILLDRNQEKMLVSVCWRATSWGCICTYIIREEEKEERIWTYRDIHWWSERNCHMKNSSMRFRIE